LPYTASFFQDLKTGTPVVPLRFIAIFVGKIRQSGVRIFSDCGKGLCGFRCNRSQHDSKVGSDFQSFEIWEIGGVGDRNEAPASRENILNFGIGTSPDLHKFPP
jgi:hypothetical protein